MSLKLLLLLGGLYHTGFAIFHLMFWRLFRWDSELLKLGTVNRAVMQILNLCLTFVFLFFAYLSVFHADELLASPLGHALLAGIALFWALRALEQWWFFGLRHPASAFLFVLFALGGGLYLWLLWQSTFADGLA